MSKQRRDLRGRFPGYFKPTDAEFEAIWKAGLIVPDTNIWLHLMRYGSATRKEVFETLGSFKKRVWVPHQVALEFLRNWRNVDADNRKVYQTLEKSVRDAKASLTSSFERVKRFDVVDVDNALLKIEEFSEAILKSVKEAEKNHPELSDAQRIFDEIVDFIGDQLGEPPTEIEFAKLIEDGTKRYEEAIPPGYLDAKTKQGNDKFGDFFIWEQLVAVAKAKSLPVLFISDDLKDDWVIKLGGREIRPRPELVNEFFERTGQAFYCYPFRPFLDQAKKYQEIALTDEAIAEIEKEERQASEKRRATQALLMQRELRRRSAQIPSPDLLKRSEYGPELRNYWIHQLRSKLASSLTDDVTLPIERLEVPSPEMLDESDELRALLNRVRRRMWIASRKEAESSTPLDERLDDASDTVPPDQYDTDEDPLKDDS